MKAICSGEKIKQAIAHADRVTGKNLTLPILSSVLCVASGTVLKFRATNLSLGIEIEIPAKIEKEGVVAVPGALLSGFLGNISQNEEITLEQTGETLIIKSKNTRVQIKTFPYEDFPTLPTVEGTPVKIPARAFLDGAESVYYAAAMTDIKPEIGSVSICQEEEVLVFAATDSFRLAEKKIPVKKLYGFQPILLPHKNTVELLRIMSGVESDLAFVTGKNLVSISFNGYRITSRIVDGVFPDYRRIFPKEKKSELILLKAELQNAVKSSTLFSDKFNQITISFVPSKKQCTLVAKNTDVGENEVQLGAALSGDSGTLVINYRYLLDCLNAIRSDSVSIEIAGDSKPVVVRGVGDASFTALIMPMNR